MNDVPLAASRRMTCEQPLQLGVAEHRGRLVEDDEAGVARQRLGDLDHLPAGDAESSDGHTRFEGEAESLGQLLGVGDEPLPVDEPEAVRREPAHEDVLRRREVVGERRAPGR